MSKAKEYEHKRPFLEIADGVLRIRQATELGYAECRSPGCFDMSYPESKLRRARTIENGALTNALTASGENLMVFYKELNNNRKMIAQIDPKTRRAEYYGIRKLTPRECFRLMDVDDDQIDKMQDGTISNSAQYRLAGNSIVVNCLYHIFRKMFVEQKNESQQLTLF